MPYSEFTKNLLKKDKDWCKYMNLHNPYRDPWPILITKNIPNYDSTSYKKFPKYNFVYDKLWVARTQGVACGELDNIDKQNIQLPIFIKPRYGNESASSKNCFKIDKIDEIDRYRSIKNMMWSDYIDEREGMTDFVLHNGVIVYQITYIYSKTQKGAVADVWKEISIDNKPPENIVKWVNKYLYDFSGICNMQYRGNKIIEVSLRLSRGGAYFYCTDNQLLIENLNSLADHNIWNYDNNSELKFKTFYSFKCYINIFIIYLIPQYLINYIMNKYDCLPFYEYYFEPGKNLGMVFFQFMNRDFKTGMKIKKLIENIMFFAQIFIFSMFILCIFSYIKKYKYRHILFVLFILIYLTRFLNPISTQVGLYKAQETLFKKYI